MPIKAVLFDLDGTLVDNSGTTSAGMSELIRWIEAKGLYWAVTSNRGRGRAKGLLQAACLRPHLVVTNDEVCAKKPSPLFCTYVAKQLGIDCHELIYVGDNDRTDAICAINAKALYFNAGWSNPRPRYGWPLSEPGDLAFLLGSFLSRDPVWYWSLECKDRLRRTVSVRSLYDARSTWNTKLVRRLRDTLKEINIIEDLRNALFFFFLANLYMDGLCDTVDWWATYPSHHPERQRDSVQRFIEFAARLFKDRFKPGLILRHTPAKKSAFVRYGGEEPCFSEQTNTVCLDPQYRQQLAGKHILVIDDFKTGGYSFECARNLLLLGGAERVTCVSFGCYRTNYWIKVPKRGVQWDPWRAQTLRDNNFETTCSSGVVRGQVLEDLANALDATR